MVGMVVGYARTSNTDQTACLEAQERALRATGAEKVFSEQVSSMAERAELNACLAFLREGDALVVTKPEYLACSTADLLAIEADLRRRGVGLMVLSMDVTSHCPIARFVAARSRTRGTRCSPTR
jgi:DNA invertase Pin-like site-specific DNA recombinase